MLNGKVILDELFLSENDSSLVVLLISTRRKVVESKKAEPPSLYMMEKMGMRRNDQVGEQQGSTRNKIRATP
jgi:hypothetical protein